MNKHRSYLTAVVLLVSAFAVAWMSAGMRPRDTAVVKVIKRCANSVVNISTEKIVMLQQNPFWGMYGGQFDEFFNQYSRNALAEMKLKGVGSGVIVSKEGMIITNAHVVNMASKIYVILHDGTTYDAQLVAVNPEEDLALIKINPSGKLRPIGFANDVMIGETVVSIGNPFGLENSVSAGIVSGTNRTFSNQMSRVAFNGLVQTDASINPGSSGGALLNLEGKLVGINLAVVQNAQSIGFAIPAAKIDKLLKEYKGYARIKREENSDNIVSIPVQ